VTYGYGYGYDTVLPEGWVLDPMVFVLLKVRIIIMYSKLGTHMKLMTLKEGISIH
jgi:hypothetical protein